MSSAGFSAAPIPVLAPQSGGEELNLGCLLLVIGGAVGRSRDGDSAAQGGRLRALVVHLRGWLMVCLPSCPLRPYAAAP